MNNTVVIIYGPTAVGKSSIAINLAKKIDGEIISADSMQIYKYMDIGTAKVTKGEQEEIPHYLIDIKYPNEEYSVAEFKNDANKYIKQIQEKGKVPIIVGGTGLYIKALIENYNFCSAEKNTDFRNSLSVMTNEEIYKKIIEIDNNNNVDKNNRQRLIRCYETLLFGVEKTKSKANFKYSLFAICDDRQNIYNRINNRVEEMAKNGLLDETKFLIDKYGLKNMQSMKAIAYKELVPFINKEKTLEDCLSILKQKSRNYAKRQITFMNQFDNLNKVDFCGLENTTNKIKEIWERSWN